MGIGELVPPGPKDLGHPSRIECGDKTYPFAPLGDVAQELVVHGGFEALIKKCIAEMERSE